jgi:hypothetical protein
MPFRAGSVPGLGGVCDSCRDECASLDRRGSWGPLAGQRMVPAGAWLGVSGDLSTRRTIRLDGAVVKPKPPHLGLRLPSRPLHVVFSGFAGISTLGLISSTLGRWFSTLIAGLCTGRRGLFTGFPLGTIERAFRIGSRVAGVQAAVAGRGCGGCRPRRPRPARPRRPAARSATPGRATPSNPRPGRLRRPRAVGGAGGADPGDAP